MRTLITRWRLIALLPLVVVAILSIGNRTGVVPAQNKEVREAANEVGIVVQGGITHGQILRFNVARLAIVVGGPPNSNAHPGGVNLELRVFDYQGNLLITHAFPNQNQSGGGVWISFFDLNADSLPQRAFDNNGRAQLTALLRPASPAPESCGFVASAEAFDNTTGKTSNWWGFEPLCAR